MNRQTYLAKNEQVTRHWRHVDATDQVLGRLAARIAQVLLGKDKPQYTPHHDVGDFVVVTNASKIRLTGRKGEHKFFQRYSGYPGGLKQYSYNQMLRTKPEVLLERAVWRMMPTNRLARQQLKKLKIYPGPEHPHQAQSPQPMQSA